MKRSKSPIPIESLLKHATCVRQIALRLVGPDRADDLTQDFWVKAVGRPPRPGKGLQAWFRRVLLNQARQSFRSDSRRNSRERQVAPPEANEDPVERFALHRDLVQRIDQLPDPYQRILLRRYYDDLSLREIAEEQGVPVSTINTRLRKALCLLREKLESDYGSRKSLALAFAPLLRDPNAPPLPLLTSSTVLGSPLLIMKAPLLITLAAATLVAGFFLWPDTPTGLGVLPLTPPNQEELALALPNKSTPMATPLKNAEPSRSAMELAEEPLPSVKNNPGNPLTGHVVDTNGVSMPSVEVWSATGDGRLIGVSAIDGSFALDGERDLGPIEVRDEIWGTALGCQLPIDAPSGPTLVVARWIDVGGTVRNQEGQAIPQAHIVTEQPTSLRATVPDVLGKSVSHEPTTRSDEFGLFRLERSLAVEGTLVLVEAQGYASAWVPLPLYSTPEFEVVLQRPEVTEGMLNGQVIDVARRPVPDAWVSLGYVCVQTDAEGMFQLLTGREGQFDRLVAIKPGHLPTILERPQSDDGTKQPWPEFLQLELGSEPLELAGRVIDQDGKPLANWKVWISDPTFFSSINQKGVMTEGLAQGLLRSTDEESGPNAAWPWSKTDGGGYFVLGGLSDREYLFRILHASSMLRVDAGPFHAGRRDVEIVVDLKQAYTAVEGMVTGEDGSPIAGVTVNTSVSTYHVPHGENGFLTWNESGSPATTDENGRYKFESLPREGVTLRLEHHDILPIEFGLRPDASGAPMERDGWDKIDFACNRRFQVQIELSPSLGDPVRIAFLEENQEESLIQVFSSGGRMSTTGYRLSELKSEVLSLSGAVREIVISDLDGNQLARQDLNLVFGELNTLRF